ncbi:hypothetical protein SDC9_179110 [bioreactor metagenome]|uniref:Uncharacterized protein n=1 Tax=bioreactor metagenome TaxID=1076179 RepID=A0A645GZH6_9ZZZZ
MPDSPATPHRPALLAYGRKRSECPAAMAVQVFRLIEWCRKLPACRFPEHRKVRVRFAHGCTPPARRRLAPPHGEPQDARNPRTAPYLYSIYTSTAIHSAHRCRTGQKSPCRPSRTDKARQADGFRTRPAVRGYAARKHGSTPDSPGPISIFPPAIRRNADPAALRRLPVRISTTAPEGAVNSTLTSP